MKRSLQMHCQALNAGTRASSMSTVVRLIQLNELNSPQCLLRTCRPDSGGKKTPVAAVSFQLTRGELFYKECYIEEE